MTVMSWHPACLAVARENRPWGALEGMQKTGPLRKGRGSAFHHTNEELNYENLFTGGMS